MQAVEPINRISEPRAGALMKYFIKMNFAYYRTHLVSLFMTLGLPLVFLVIYSFAYMSSSAPSKVQVALSPSAQRALAGYMGGIPSDAVHIVPTSQSAKDALKSMPVQVAIDKDGKTGKLTVYASPPVSGLAHLLAWTLEQQPNKVTPTAQQVQVHAYQDPMSPLSFLPGVLLMSILNLSLFTTGTKILQERAQGTLRLFRMLPSPFWAFLGAELLGMLVISLIQSVIFIILALLVTGIVLPLKAIVLAVLVAILATACLLSLGIALGSWLGSFSSGVHAFTLTNLLIVFLGDLFFPASSYAATKPIALILPTTYCADMLRNVMFGHELHFPLVFSIGYICIFTAACTFFASRVFRFTARS